MSYEDIALLTGFRPLACRIDDKMWETKNRDWQFLAYLTNPIDDLIRAAVVPMLATIAHFYDI